MRTALFGGSFDPPHRGHLAIAQAAAQSFALDQVLFAPTGLQPLKPAGATAPFADRLAMVELLCQQDARFQPSTLDKPRPGAQPNYAIDTLQTLRADLPATVELFAIVGADSFLDLRRWRSPDALLAIADWIVVSRPGFSLSNLEPFKAAENNHDLLGRGFSPAPSPSFAAVASATEGLPAAEKIPSATSLALTPQQLKQVHLLEGIAEPASATAIRTALHTGADCSAMLTAPVLAYIREHNLYTPTSPLG